MKTLGVFNTCGQGERVADPRVLGTDDVVDHLWNSWKVREEARSSLAKRLPDVRAESEEQIERALSTVATGPCTAKS